MQFSYLAPSSPTPEASFQGALVLFVDKDNQLLGDTRFVDEVIEATLQGLLDNKHLKKSAGSSCQAPLAAKNTRCSLLLVRTGVGAQNMEAWHELASAAARAIAASVYKEVQIDVTGLGNFPGSEQSKTSYLVAQIVKAAYRFNEFKSSRKNKSALASVLLLSSQSEGVDAAIQRGVAVGQAVNLARTLGDRPGNHCTPSHLADEALALAEGFANLTCDIHEEAQLRQLGMGAFLSVSAGSDQPAKLIEMRYQGGADSDNPYVLIGKGVTFDTGGISIKPAAAMDEMKYDMCGAASVFGVIQAAASLGLPINLVGLIAATENMPGGDATKPGDIVTSMSGKTIEVLNTDAEGRLVLCDTLTYAQQLKPRLMIDIATLTGACVVALGAHASGLYSNSDSLANALLDAGTQTNDRAWRMPLWKPYTKQLESRFADLGNIGGPKAGSVTAACFLQEFVEGVDWAHLDIAGTAWHSGANKGATGRPVELLLEFLFGQSA